MAFAVRRLVLRARAINSKRTTSLSSHSLAQSPLHSSRRQFHPASSRWRDDKSSSTTPSNPEKPAIKNEPLEIPSQASSQEASKATDVSSGAKSAEQVEEVKQLSPEQQEIAAQKEQLVQDLGRPLNKYEANRIEQDYFFHLVETGQKDKIRSLLTADGMSKEGVQEIEELNELKEKLEAEELKYEKLADALEQAGDDPSVLDPLLEKLQLSRDDLQSGRVVRDGLKDIDTEGMDAKDEEDLERQIYEKMQRLRGVSEAAIANERRQNQLEDLLMDQDPDARGAMENALMVSKLREVANDERLLRTLQNEGSLHELWSRLGWNAADGKPLKRDLVAWEQLLRIAHPDSRKILQQVRDRDRQFGNDFYGERQMELLEKDKREKPGFWNYEDDEDMGEDEVFQQDDLPRAGHQELELKREIRKYARMMVWELPLLSKLAKPFTPPAEEQVLRFRYTTYMGEKHPSEHKVVVEFSPSKLNITTIERSKLIKLAAARYNPSTDIVKISCESFETAAQNKRYLGDQVEVLIKEAKDATDTFEDVPFDFRHHKPKPFHAFPEHWKLTPDRKAALLAARAQAQAMADARRAATGAELDGKQYLPGGPEQRTMEANRARQIEAEQALQPESMEILTEREKEALFVQQTARVRSDKLVRVADRKARRPAKRDRYVGRALALQRRLGPAATAVVAEASAEGSGSNAEV